MLPKTLIWPGSTAKAKAIQIELRAKLNVRSRQLLAPIRMIAGIDVAFPQGGRTTRAAAVVWDMHTRSIMARHTVELPTCMPYIPGYLSFREGPAIWQLLNSLPIQPELLMFDGNGTIHKEQMGIASHIGIVRDIPALGVAKQALYGEFGALAKAKLSHMPVMDPKDKSHLGYALRSRAGVKPVFVSSGHKISQQEALALVVASLGRYKLPEPTHYADKLSKSASN